MIPEVELAELRVEPTKHDFGIAYLEKNNAMVLLDIGEYVEYSPLIWEISCLKS
jgi:hypothetical protein